MRISGDLYKDDPPAVSVFPPSHVSPLEGVQLAMPDSASIATAANAPSNRSHPDADYPLVLYETWHDLTSTYDPEDVPTSDAPRLRDLGENRSNGTQGHVSHDQERDWYVSLHDFRDCKRYRMPSRADHDPLARSRRPDLALDTSHAEAMNDLEVLPRGDWQELIVGWLDGGTWYSLIADLTLESGKVPSTEAARIKRASEAISGLVDDHQQTLRQTPRSDILGKMNSEIQTAIKSSSELIARMLIKHVETIKPITGVSVET